MRKSRMVMILIVATAIGLGVLLFTTAQAKGPKKPPGGCFCAMVYAPVECDQGVFSNQCVADCRNATNCEPIGPGPIPL